MKAVLLINYAFYVSQQHIVSPSDSPCLAFFEIFCLMHIALRGLHFWPDSDFICHGVFCSGMKICGGQNDDGTYTGIFVKRILLGGAVASDGMLLCFHKFFLKLLQYPLY